MPISFEAGQFHIILRQPKHLYGMAWKLAERHDAEERRIMEPNKIKTVDLAQMTQQDRRF